MEPDRTIMTFPNEAAWLAARHRCITASDCALIMGSPKHRAWMLSDQPDLDPVVALWVLKRQPRQALVPSIPMRMGTALEPLCAALYAEQAPGVRVVSPYDCYGMHTAGSRGWASATLDRDAIAEATGELWAVECKTGMYAEGNFARTYEWQCRWQMYVADRERTDIACLQKARGKFWVERVRRHEGYNEDRMVLRCAEFNGYVQSGQEPPRDWIYEVEF